MDCITAVWITSRFPSGPVYSYHGYFRYGSGFMPVFVKFYGSLMAHGNGSEKSRVVTARFNRGMYRGFETVKSPSKNDPDVKETAFGKDFSSLGISLVAVTVPKCLVHLSLLVLRSRKWYQRQLYRRDLPVGLGQRKSRNTCHGVGPECGSSTTMRAYRIMLCL